MTGGKDLGKRKGVAIDYLTGHGREWILVCDEGRRPLSFFRAKRRRGSPLGTRTKAKVVEPTAVYTYGGLTREPGSRTPATTVYMPPLRVYALSLTGHQVLFSWYPRCHDRPSPDSGD